MAFGSASSVFSSHPTISLNFQSCNTSFSSTRLGVLISRPAAAAWLSFTLHNIPHFHSSLHTRKTGFFQLHSAVESVTAEDEEEKEEEVDEENSRKPQSRKKLFVLNLPWSFSVADIKKLFSECGTVADVEIIKQKDGKNRGFAFVTMSSGEEAQTAIDKFDSYEAAGRIIRVQFAKRFKKPPRTVPAAPLSGETRHKLYVSNLAWKVRSNNLRDFFSANFNPVSARVVFDSPSGRSAGYGFVSFATKEEAESAISELDGKELLGRPIRLNFSEKNLDASASKEESNSDDSESKEESSQQQSEES